MVSFHEEEHRAPRLMRVADWSERFLQEIGRLTEAKRQGLRLGPSTGIPALDALLGERLEVGVHAVHAAPGIGKSALLLQISQDCGYPAVYLSCEMHWFTLMARVIARQTSTDIRRITSAEFDLATMRVMLEKSVYQTPLMHLVDSTQSAITPEQLETFIAVARGESPHLVLVVDSLHRLAERLDSSAVDEYTCLNEALDLLSALAFRLNIVVLAIVERNRSSMDKAELSAGAGTRRIEYSAESVWALSRPEQGDSGEDERTCPIELRVVKNRSGRCGSITLQFDRDHQTFSEDIRPRFRGGW